MATGYVDANSSGYWHADLSKQSDYSFGYTFDSVSWPFGGETHAELSCEDDNCAKCWAPTPPPTVTLSTTAKPGDWYLINGATAAKEAVLAEVYNTKKNHHKYYNYFHK